MARITDNQNSAHRLEREHLRNLLASPGWPVFAAHIEEIKQERIDGLAMLGADKQARDEHVRGYHDAKELPGWPAKRIAELDALITRHMHGQ